MLSVRRTAVFLGVLSAGVMSASALLVPPQAQAAGFLDRLFNRNAQESVESHLSAGEKSEIGNNSINASVSNTNTSFFDDMLLRLQGPPQDPKKSNDPKAVYDSELQRHYGRGAIGDVAGAIRYLYQPPASTQTFVADLLHDAHIVPKAQAQGLGFAALDPILATWKMFRNLAYLLYVVVFLVIGFMVMFKAQMGKTAVTLQSALPNIVTSLIFVTFSYAIAGFLIDFMYVVMYLLVGMFPTSGGSEVMNYNFLQLGLSIVMGDGQNTGAFRSFAASVDDFVSAATTFSGVGEENNWFGAISGVTMALIMSVAVLVGVFKLFFELLKTYVTIVLYIAFAPLILMIGAIPGQDVLQGWIRDLIGNLMAFPTTLLIIIVFRMFTNSTQTGGTGFDNVGGFLPPFLIGQGSGGAVTTLVGIGIVLIMPELIKEMKKAMGVKDGIFTVLAKDMVGNIGKNFKQGSAVAEAGAITGAGLAGGIRGGASYLRNRKNKFDIRSLGEAIVGGHDIGGTKFGGAANWGEKTRAVTNKGRVFMDRLSEGRLFDPEDLTKLIADRLGKNTKGGKP